MIGTIIFILKPSRPVPTCIGLKKMPKWCFSVFKIFFAIFFFNYLLGVGLEIIGTIIFILTLSRPFPTKFCLARCHNGVFLIVWIFLLFFLILYYGSGKKCSERKFLFSLVLGLSQPVFTWKVAIMVFFSLFFNFLLFFGILYNGSGRKWLER